MNKKNYDYKETAKNYDEQVKEYNNYIHDVMFGMSYEFVNSGDRLLDIGIGTGLSSIPFSKAGLKVFGIDQSEDMLNVCRVKSFAEELKLSDISCNKIPYEDNSFNHIICCGVLHFFSDLKKIFSEAARVISKDGIFAFTISPQESEKEYIEQSTPWGVSIFRHSPAYIRELLLYNGMELVKEQLVVVRGADKVNYENIFSIMVAKFTSNNN